MTRWLIRLAVVLALAGAAGGGFLLWTQARFAAPGPGLAPTTVVIPHGDGSQAIAQQLQEAGVIDQGWLFLLATKMGSHRSLLAGEYLFPQHASLNTIVEMMRKGQVVVHKFTVAEGLTVQQVLAGLRQAEGLAGRVGQTPDEGSLLPQTYFYSFGDPRDGLINRMTRSMNETLDELWPARKPGLPVANKIEALILASIVERETALPEERPHVAAVYENRIKLHMRLQSDPTVIYAVSAGEGVLDRALTRDDLNKVNPYNTYAVDGLPPGPICNPGRASLQAVLNPAVSDDLYFVADGNGGHVFAKTLIEHNKNVAKWRATLIPASKPKAK